MKGLYCYEDRQEITFMWLFNDGRVLFLGRPKKQHQFVYEIFTQEPGELDFASGKFIVLDKIQLRMILDDGHGKIIVKGEIINESTIRLAIRSRETNFIDKKEFHRYSDDDRVIYIRYDDQGSFKNSKDLMKILDHANKS